MGCVQNPPPVEGGGGGVRGRIQRGEGTPTHDLGLALVEGFRILLLLLPCFVIIIIIVIIIVIVIFRIQSLRIIKLLFPLFWSDWLE